MASLTTAELPIACTEGWSTVQHWTGVPLADLARLAGVDQADAQVALQLPPPSPQPAMMGARS